MKVMAREGVEGKKFPLPLFPERRKRKRRRKGEEGWREGG